MGGSFRADGLDAAGSLVGDLRIIGTKTILPTEDVLDALKGDYALDAGVADLVDNSIDAGARNILIRFRRIRERLVGLCVVDDGHGMDDTEIDLAMQFARRREYGASDLGMFGMGLKSASLSQADVLSVMSRKLGGHPVGRQWSEPGIKKRHWECSVLDENSVLQNLNRGWGGIGAVKGGTIIRWDEVRDFERIRGNPDLYLHKIKTALRNHLGLKLHRFLLGIEGRPVSINIDVEDVATGEVFPPSTVSPLNPFPERSATAGYPRFFDVDVEPYGRLRFMAHIWPKRSKDEGYRLGGGRVAEHQGFYFFRHGRLIQDGGWNGWMPTTEPHLSLARVAVDIPDGFARHLTVRPNKAGVDVPAAFADWVADARANNGKTTLREFVQIAEETYRKRGELRLKPLVRPGKGVPATVRAALERQHVRMRPGRGIAVKWGKVAGRAFFAVDREQQQLVLNKKYRLRLLNGLHGGSADLPILRTLLYLLLNATFQRENEGKLEKARLAAINAALVQAVELEMKRQYD